MVKKGNRGRKPLPMKQYLRWRHILLASLITAIAILSYAYISKHNNEARLQQSLHTKQLQLEAKIKELQKTGSDVKTLQQQKQDLEKQLQSKRAKQEADKVYAESLIQAPQTSFSCGDAKSCIYWHESGNNPASVNSIGCRGLGQACPGSKLPCGADYACQDAYFTNYAIQRYGSWENAWAFWQVNRWW